MEPQVAFQPDISSSGSRAVLSANELVLPDCPLPRKGDRVVWYQNALLMKGTLVGHNKEGSPEIVNDHGGNSSVRSFAEIRLEDRGKAVGPCWTRMSDKARIFRPTAGETARFKELLDQRTPPGPRYLDLLTEVWTRGFEVFVVGGTVRDVIASYLQQDVDLVTTMPIHTLFALIQGMYGHPRKLDEAAMKNGHLRVGGGPGSGDPFIDLCTFKYRQPASPSALFSTDLDRDAAHRDFTCNSVYYDPINEALLDPSGFGIADIESKTLRLICDASMRSPIQMGQISVRLIKFLTRGFSQCDECSATMKTQFRDSISALPKSIRVAYVRAQVLSKHSHSARPILLDGFRDKMIDHGFEAEWNTYFEPLRQEILND